MAAVIRWYDVHERPLPWRSSTPWGVLVSEFMLQQTPVDRVLPVWDAWMQRWPAPPDLAGASIADALRAWGRLGYPRRAQRLHRAAGIITRDHGGTVPSDLESLLALPGVGEYTAAAVRSFAFDSRAIVLDTNVRRVLARALDGVAVPLGHITARERAAADEVWPSGHRRSARWSAAVMELGALVCTARRPNCDECPVRGDCAWLAAGRPPAATATRRQAPYSGSDREARGRILAALREQSDGIDAAAAEHAWPAREQRERALRGLIGDGLVVERPGPAFALAED